MLIYIGVLSAVLSAIINLLLGASLVNIFLHVITSTVFIIVVYLVVDSIVKSYLPDLLGNELNNLVSGNAATNFSVDSKNEDKPKENVIDIADNLKTASFTNLGNVELDEGELSKNFGVKKKSIESAAGAVRSSLNNRETR